MSISYILTAAIVIIMTTVEAAVVVVDFQCFKVFKIPKNQQLNLLMRALEIEI